jgi:hypothetical protein
MAVYRLPFENDGQWTTHTGNWDDPGWGHYKPGGPTDEQAYAWDFNHPQGGHVLAARAGTVINLDAETPDGDTKGDGPGGGSGNFLWIKHADGSLAAYLHLKHHSIQVVVGQWVAQGQRIATSGFTGHASAPHLHFDVHSHVTSAKQPDLGVHLMTHFEDLHHKSWRPRAGQNPHSNNSTSHLRQDFWKHCGKCQGLYFAGNASSTCPAGDAHDSGGGGNYTLAVNSPASSGQNGWRHCVKCEGLFFSGHSGSRCPAGSGAHHANGSGDYTLVVDVPGDPGQHDWRRCSKCQGLFYAGLSSSVCPADGHAHSHSGSGNYALHVTAADTQPNWRWCFKCQGLFYAGNSGSSCPASGHHAATGGAVASGNYILAVDSEDAPGQQGWRWCSKCQGLWMSMNSGSVCPAGGHHRSEGSGKYALIDTGAFPASNGWPGQEGWRWCSKCQGIWMGTNQGSRCPADGPHVATGSGHYAIQVAMF